MSSLSQYPESQSFSLLEVVRLVDEARESGAAEVRARVMAELEVASSYRLSERVLTALLAPIRGSSS